MTRAQVIISGYASLDRIIDIDNPLRSGCTSLIRNEDNSTICFGGCSVNTAYGLAKLGVCATPCIRVGDDPEGLAFQEFLVSAGVSTEAVRSVANARTPNSYLLTDSQGQQVTVFFPGAMGAESVRALDSQLFADRRLGVVTVSSAGDNRAFLEQCQRFQLPVAFGMKSDFCAFPDDLLRSLIEYSTVVFLNESESRQILARLGLRSITEVFTGSNLRHVVVTSGARGSTVFTRNANKTVKTRISTVTPAQVVDVTGSGDAFMAGFLCGYLNDASALECGRLGSTMASFAVEARGACTAIPQAPVFWERYRRTFGKDTNS